MLRRYFLLLLLLLLLLGGVIVTTTRYVNLNGYKAAITDVLKEQYKLIATIKGDITIEFSPAPYLLLNGVVIEYSGETLFRINELKVMLPIIATVLNKGIADNVSLIIADGGSVAVQHLYRYIRYDQAVLNGSGIENLKFMNFTMTYRDYDSLYMLNDMVLDDIDITLKGNEIAVKGGTTYKKKLQNQINIMVHNFNSDNASINSTLAAQGFSLNASGTIDLKNYDKGNAIIKLELSDFSKFISYFGYVNDDDDQEPKGGKDGEDKKQGIDISANITLDTNGLLRVSNISSRSSAITGLSSSVIVDLSTKDTYKINASLSAKSINFDNFLDLSSIDASLRKKMIFLFVSSLYSGFDMMIPASIIGDFQISIDSIKAFGESIDKTYMGFNMIQGNLIIDDLKAKLPGEGNIILSGISTNNGIRADFRGNIQLKVADFSRFGIWLGLLKALDDANGIKTINIETDFSMIPRRLKFSNTSLMLNDSLMNGKVSFIKDGYGKVSAYVLCRIVDIDLDSMGLDSSIDDVMYLLYSSDFDKSGDTYYKLINNYGWLRNLNSSWHLDFIADNMMLKGDRYNNFQFIADIANNNLEVTKFSFATPAIDMSGDFKCTLPAFRVFVEANLNIKNLDLTNSNAIYSNYVSRMRDRLLKVTPKSSNIVTMIDNINFFSANNYDASVNLTIKDAMMNGNKLFSDLSSDIKLTGGIGSLQCSFASMDGKLTVAGNAVIMGIVPQFNGTFILDNVNPNKVLYYIAGLNKMNGYMSVSGAISTYGTNKYNLLRQMDGAAMFAGKRIYWDGIGLDNIIQAVDSGYAARDKLKQIEYYAQNGRSIFDDMSGTIRLTAGVATLPDIRLSNNRLSSVFAANYDIPSRTVSSNGIASFIPMSYTGPLSIQIKTTGQFPDAVSEVNIKQVTDFIAPNGVIEDDANKLSQQQPVVNLRNRL